MRPMDEAALAAAVAQAEGPLRIIGGGTRPVGRPVAGQVLSTAGLSGIRLYEPGALTLVAGAGTPLAEVEAALAGEHQRLPFEPMDHRALLGTDGAPTLGGMVAANASGPVRMLRGACRDSLIGVRFVDGTGRAVSNGGRVMKNVTGYDLVKLMAGSWGTLGVLTEVSFKLLPCPETVAVLRCGGLDDAAAIRALTAALATPFEVTGAAHLQLGADGAPVTMIRIEGFEQSVSYRAGQLRAALAEFGSFELEADPARAAADWADLRDVRGFAGAPGDVWHLSTVPGDAPGLVARLPGARAQYDWGGGRVWLLVPEGEDVRAKIGPFKGHATLVRASEATRTRIPSFPPEPAPVARLSADLRHRFDPRGILNPGLMD
ncbi:2-hydroxy-acid oxidase [Meridianimarinicoccus roseus]|uniref:2-hydroxy-acid oxidase n=1 Tax=Meridianimarinicoccus roseus TaxID=2072018 RepID=A0A2V2LR75_9RHOB|nr:FAD-binding protein [Meridianimarinicoccus roseus]PWR03973.1 2-hydroxy-acid oxidase [Meridianimarinicoccus roseus]